MRIIDADELIKRLEAHRYPFRTPARSSEVTHNQAINEAIRTVEEMPDADRIHRGMYECFHCGALSVSWDSDFDFEDFGYDGVGIVQCCHCNNCGADIEYRIRFDDNQDN